VKEEECTEGFKKGAEKVPRERKSVPQRLKPRRKQNSFGTAEAVPLSKTDFQHPVEASLFRWIETPRPEEGDEKILFPLKYSLGGFTGCGKTMIAVHGRKARG
jgi:hypothetical protein